MALILKPKKLMTKNLEEKFIFYCNSKNLEINQYQLKVINKITKFL